MGCDYYEETLLWDFTNDCAIFTIASVGMYGGSPVNETIHRVKNDANVWYELYYAEYHEYIEYEILDIIRIRELNVLRVQKKQEAERAVLCMKEARHALEHCAAPVKDAIEEKIAELETLIAVTTPITIAWKIPLDVGIATWDRAR